MHNVWRLVVSVSAVAWTTACNGGGGGGGSGTVNYNPATNADATPAGVNLLITRAGVPNLEVQARSGPSANLNSNFGNPLPNQRMEFNVLATATDAESGIRNIKLLMTRTVCYRTSAGNIAQAYSGTVTRKEANYTDQTRAPVQASLGDTGIFDPTIPAHGNPDNLLVWTNANQQRGMGVGVSTRWSMEARNFAGSTTYSDAITMFAGDVSCVTNP